MLLPAPPMSNTERQRLFRERHPGYYQRLHARRRAAIMAMRAERVAAEQAITVKREPLLLPAPVETVEIPGMTTIRSDARELLAMEATSHTPSS